MDFGVMGLNDLVRSVETTDPEAKQKWYGSEFLKQGRSENVGEDDWRSLKLAKTEDFSVSKGMLSNNQRSNNLFFSDGQHNQQQQMLSFSSPKSEASLYKNGGFGGTVPYYYHTQSACNGNTGYNSENMHGFLTGVRGPFTPSQWMELEHQALIYKYINSNVPIPTNLLVPIKKALDFAGFSSYSGIPYRPNSMGWGSFHLGFSNTDPEPGRCRRTDGKKWRCSRDAVVDQKYCERHINRGRHRSRKPVEGQSGQSVAGTTTTASTKLMPISSSSPASVAAGGGSGGGVSNGHMMPSASDKSAGSQINRIYTNKTNMNDDSSMTIRKQQARAYEQSNLSDFGIVSSDCLLNPSQKNFTFTNYEKPNTSSQLPFRHFMDDFTPKTHTDRSTLSWPDMGIHLNKNNNTQLSISIPKTPSDFMSSTSSPTNEKSTLSPLRISREHDQIQMGLSVGSVENEEEHHRQANWVPISWESSVGGPLGEVLHNKANCSNSSALNLMTEGWDNSPRIGSSPTGVLQKTAFGSLSNSSASAGSSPRAVQ